MTAGHDTRGTRRALVSPEIPRYRLTREGRIPVVKLGRYYRYRLDEIERFEVGHVSEGR